MKFTLKDYQEEAVADVLVNMRKASKRWQEDGDIHAFSLTATTGAGKTVMAAAVFEAPPLSLTVEEVWAASIVKLNVGKVPAFGPRSDVYPA